MAHCIFRSRVIFLAPGFFWRAEGEVGFSFGAGLAGLGCVLPRSLRSSEGVVAHEGNPPLLSGGELGGWSRVRGCWSRRCVGTVAGLAALEGGGLSTTWAQMSRGCVGGACTAPPALAPQRTHHRPRYSVRPHQLVNVEEGTPEFRELC